MARAKRASAKAAPRAKAKREAWKPSPSGALVKHSAREERVAALVRATYDAAQTTDRNENLWAAASGKSADAEASPSVRATIRNRCRYEARNNSYCAGMLDTRALDTVGKCPRVELLTEEKLPDGVDVATLFEADFAEWAREVRLGAKLRQAMRKRGEDGEAFLEIVTDLSLSSPVKLNVQPIECDRVTAQLDRSGLDDYSDGILYDDNGKPLEYDVLNYHPGTDTIPATGLGGYRTVPAARMLHFYRQTRPGLRRGVPDMAPALNLFGMIRRYSLAVLTAAETAAAVAWALVSKSEKVDPIPVDPEQVIELASGSGLTIPAGWGLEQLKAEQPTTTHREYIRGLLNEAARCMQMPLNVALADSSQYNYASGRLDHQVYHRAIEVDRYDLGVEVLSPALGPWAREWAAVRLARFGWTLPAHEWYFDGFEHVDPSKEAAADDQRLKDGTLTYRLYFSRRGMDWRTAFEQRAEEAKYAAQLGLKLAGDVPAPAPEPEPDETDTGEETGDAAGSERGKSPGGNDGTGNA